MTRQLWRPTSFVWASALLLFVITIVIGILNGLDIWEPPHDTLITHVHAGTLGWITLAVFGAALLVFTEDVDLDAHRVRSATRMAYWMVGAIALYVAAFWVGQSIPGNRLQRPIVGTLVFVVIIWSLVWMWRRHRNGQSSVPRMALLLSWVSLFFGAILGVILGLFSSRGEIPGISDETASSLASAHPPAMIIGFLILAAAGVAEWLLKPESATGRNRAWGMAQVWILFAAGMLVNVAFVIRMEDQILPPANLLQVVALVILIVRLWSHLKPSQWSGQGAYAYPRMTVLFLVVNLGLFAYLISQIVSGSLDFDNPSEAEMGLILTLDHFMFIGVATNALLGAVALTTSGRALDLTARLTLWGVNLGLLGFAAGLITVTPVLKRISTPIMGLALLVGIVKYFRQLVSVDEPVTVEVG